MSRAPPSPASSLAWSPSSSPTASFSTATSDAFPPTQASTSVSPPPTPSTSSPPALRKGKPRRSKWEEAEDLELLHAVASHPRTLVSPSDWDKVRKQIKGKARDRSTTACKIRFRHLCKMDKYKQYRRIKDEDEHDPIDDDAFDSAGDLEAANTGTLTFAPAAKSDDKRTDPLSRDVQPMPSALAPPRSLAWSLDEDTALLSTLCLPSRFVTNWDDVRNMTSRTAEILGLAHFDKSAAECQARYDNVLRGFRIGGIDYACETIQTINLTAFHRAQVAQYAGVSLDTSPPDAPSVPAQSASRPLVPPFTVSSSAVVPTLAASASPSFATGQAVPPFVNIPEPSSNVVRLHLRRHSTPSVETTPPGAAKGSMRKQSTPFSTSVVPVIDLCADSPPLSTSSLPSTLPVYGHAYKVPSGHGTTSPAINATPFAKSTHHPEQTPPSELTGTSTLSLASLNDPVQGSSASALLVQGSLDSQASTHRVEKASFLPFASPRTSPTAQVPTLRQLSTIPDVDATPRQARQVAMPTKGEAGFPPSPVSPEAFRTARRTVDEGNGSRVGAGASGSVPEGREKEGIEDETVGGGRGRDRSLDELFDLVFGKDGPVA
ncbi:hypothetical protein JCM10212_001581 [Sporobolomyces blumeae]